MRSARAESGFTLVEILVVIAIIGILAAIAIPLMLGNKEEAYQANMESDLTNTAVLLHQEWTDNSRMFTTVSPSGVPQARTFPAATQVSEETEMRLKVSPDATRGCLVGWVKGQQAETSHTYDIQKRALFKNDRATNNGDCLDPNVGWVEVASISG